MGFVNNLDKQYTDLLRDILENGTRKGDRTGTGTISVFGRQIRHNMKDGFPLLTTKKMPFKTIVTELLWFLRGDTNIKFLVDNNCHIWDGDAYKNYHVIMNSDEWIENWVEAGEQREEAKKNKGSNGYTLEEFIHEIKTDDEFAKTWGELGPIYGKQWRKWSVLPDKYGAYNRNPIDQIQNLINDLKTNPDSRRLMVNAWNVGELDQMVLPPCHYGFQVYTRKLKIWERYEIRCKRGNLRNDWEQFYSTFGGYSDEMDSLKKSLNEDNIPTRAISLMWNQRSVDTFLGLPFNIASYGLLLEIIAKEVNMVPDELIGNLGDVHLYSNHVDQAMEQIGRDLTDEERYNIWFNNNYETGMERYFDPNNLPDFDNEYYEPTPKRTREPFPLPTLKIKYYTDNQMIKPKLLPEEGDEEFYEYSDFILEGYQSHPTIKAPLSN